MKAIGIDIGTTSICLVLYDPENGRIEESAGAPNEFLEGGFRQDADRIVSVIKEKLDWLLDRNADVGVIGVSAQMHGILYVDREGGALSPYYTWKETCRETLFEGLDAAQWLSRRTNYPRDPLGGSRHGEHRGLSGDAAVRSVSRRDRPQHRGKFWGI